MSDTVRRGYRVLMMYHPSCHVTDLADTEAFYERVFGRFSTPLGSIMTNPPRAGHATDYSTFTPIADVLMDSVDPKRYVTDGVQRYPSVDKPHLKTFGWYVDGISDLYRELKRQGIRVTNSQDVLAEGDEPPMAGSMPLFHALRDDAGIRYHFFPLFPFPADPRTQPGWSLPPVSDEDPLGIEFCSHHTVLTGNLDRALKLVVDALGGTIIHEGRDDLRHNTATWVHLGDSLLQYGSPDAGAREHADWARDDPNDTYHAITWKVADLGRARRHLEDQGVTIDVETEDTIITSPDTSLGIPWGFTTRLIPGDPRG